MVLKFDIGPNPIEIKLRANFDANLDSRTLFFTGTTTQSTICKVYYIYPFYIYYICMEQTPFDYPQIGFRKWECGTWKGKIPSSSARFIHS